MWLINTASFRLEEFVVTKAPEYAILSHTWGEDEVTFKDMNDLNDGMKEKRGYLKIEMTCKLAGNDGVGYVWIDTCCIDKSSSAELTEAINSMYTWYQQSVVCYAYLCDLRVVTSEPLATALESCRWFSRG